MTGVAVIGGGTMGTGIAHAFAVAGDDVTVVDASLDIAAAAVARARLVLDEAVARGKLDQEAATKAAGRLRPVGSVDDVPPGLDLIVEAVPERSGLKRTVLERAEAARPTVLATNTSSLALATLATGLSRPDRFVGMHFFNPVWSSSLVEVVVADGTSDATRERAVGHVATIAKEAIVVRDSPGFATSRLGLALGLEAIRMVEDEVASPADIDRAMELGYRHPTGPLRLTDLIGLDVRLDIARGLEESLGSRFAPPALLVELVAEGRLGRKAGHGFYRWPGLHPHPRP